jgi:hypothetical protein
MTTPPASPHPAVAARHARVRRIRARVAAGTAALFIALFSGLYVQMATGHDPALGTTSAQVAAASQTNASSSQNSTSATQQQQDPAPMTTSAS